MPRKKPRQKSSRQFTLAVVITVTSDVSEDEASEYVANATRYWGAQYNENHPLFVEHIERVEAIGMTDVEWYKHWVNKSGSFGSAKGKRP